MIHHYLPKVCQRCGKEYQPTSGKQKRCAECRPAAEVERYEVNNAKRYRDNSEREKERSAKRRREYPEKVKEESARWRRQHPEEAKRRSDEWHEKNPERSRELSAKWRKENPEKAEANYAQWREAGIKWREENPEKESLRKSKRRALKYDNTPISEMLTSTEWLAILAEHNGRCHYCGKKAKLTLDHVTPLSRGGRHSKDNVVPACIHCNSSKGARTLEDWRFVLSAEAA